MYIPYQEIVNQLELREDDILLIASDITQLAYTSLKNKEKFNTNLFVDSFKHKLKKGTVLFPAFVDHFKNGDLFDKLKTAPEMGSLSKLTFARVDFMRSSDPLHSFTVIGKYSDDISEINSDSTFGDNSVFAFLKEKKAKMLLIDVDLQHSFTFAHYVEENQEVNYRKYANLDYNFVNEQGIIEKRKMAVFTKKKGVVNTLNNFEELFIESGAMGKIQINGSIFRLIHLDTAFEIMKNDIQNNKAGNMYSFEWQQFIRATIKSLIGR